MADEKKIIFSGQDNVSQKSNQIYQGIIGNAQKYNATLKEQVSFINQQIKALETKAKLEKASNEAALKDLEKQTKAAAPGLVQQQLTKTLISERQQRGSKDIENVEAITLLKELVAETKKNSTASEKAEKEAVKETQRKAKYENFRSARAEAMTDPEGVKKKFAAAESTGYGGMSSSQIERLQYQGKLVGKSEEKPTESTFKAVFTGMIAAGAFERVVHGVETAISSPTGEQSVNSLLGAIPFVGGVMSEASNRAFEEQSKVSIGLNRLRAISGSNDIGLGGRTSLGFSSSEDLGLQSGLLGAAGSSKNLRRNNLQSQQLERGMGLSQQTLIEMVKTARVIGSTSDLIKITSDVIKANPDLVKDQTRTSEIIQAQLSLTNTIAQQTENVSQGEIAKTIGGLRSVGGNLANNPDYLLKVAGNINQSLTHPASDFQKAQSFGVLSGLKPGASYLELLEMQEKGASQKGYLGGTLKELQKTAGGGENFALATMQRFGLQASTSRKLTEAFAKNPKMFDTFKGNVSEESIKDILGEGRAKRLTAKKDVQVAEQEEGYLKGAIEGAFTGITQTFESAADKLSGATDQFAATVDKMDKESRHEKNTVYSE